MALGISHGGYAAGTRIQTVVSHSCLKNRSTVIYAGKADAQKAQDALQRTTTLYSFFPAMPSMIPAELEIPVPSLPYFELNQLPVANGAVLKGQLQHLFPFHNFW